MSKLIDHLKACLTELENKFAKGIIPDVQDEKDLNVLYLRIKELKRTILIIKRKD